MEKAAVIFRCNVTLLTIVLCLCATMSSVADSTGVLPVGQPEYDFLYGRMEREHALSRDRFDYQVGPYRFDYDRFELGPLENLKAAQGVSVDLFGFAGERIDVQKEKRGTAFESLRAGFAARPVKSVFVYAAFRLDEELAKDPDYNGKVWRGFAGDVEQAFGYFDTDKFSLVAGRYASFWGPQSSLIFGPHQKLDGLGYTFKLGRLSVSYRLARLDGLSPEEDSTMSFENRYVAAHRFDFHFADNLRAGLFEMVVFGGAGRTIDLFYLNPLIFFHGTQLNEDTNDNTAVGIDFDWQPMLGLSIYGQMLLDDIQIDNDVPTDKEPAEYGVIAGVYVADLMSDFDIKAEYSRVTNWTFNQMLPRNRYMNDGDPIGAVRGTDYDLAQIWMMYWLRDDLRIQATGAHYRQGEGRIDAEWTQPWVDAEGDYSEPFPTGVVEKTSTLALAVNGFVTSFAFVEIEGGANFVSNRNHVDGDDVTLPFVRIQLTAFLSGLVDLD